MKKTTGKALSLVLSLALVLTSFSATFASASTKTATGIVSSNYEDDLYLVNGGTGTYTKRMELNSWMKDEALETKEHEDVSDIKVAAVSHVSGDKLVSCSIDTDEDTAYLKLKSSSADGKEVVSVLWEGDYTDDDGNEYTIKAKKELTVHVFDEDGIVFGSNTDTDIDSGKAPDDMSDLPVTANYTTTLGIFKAEHCDDSCLARYELASVTGDSGKDITNANLYYCSISAPSGCNVTIPKTADTGITLPVITMGKGTATDGVYPDNAGTGNVTVTVKALTSSTGKCYTPSSDADDKYTCKFKVAKKINAEQAYLNEVSGSTAAEAEAANFTVSKYSGKTYLYYGDDTLASATDYILDFNTSGTVSIDEDTNVKEIIGSLNTVDIGDANVGEIDLDSGSVTLADGKVGDITLDDDGPNDADASCGATVTITSGRCGNIDLTDCEGEAEEIVDVNGGTTGTIDCEGTVSVDSQDDDEPVSTGLITTPDIDTYVDEAKVSISGIKSSNDGTITFKGDDEDLDLGSLDTDYRDVTLDLGDDDDAFIGTIPAPANATNTKLETLEDDTAVKVTGAIDLDSISLDSDTSVVFDNTVSVGTIDGDGSMTVAAGKLYIDESASGVTLKLSDKTLAVGTTAFTAAADEVDEDDMDCFGFTLTKTSGSSVDTFKIESLSFAGLSVAKNSTAIDTDEIIKGNSATYTAIAYPTGTSVPSGYTVEWDRDGGSDDVFDMTTSSNTTTIKVKSIDETFSSENKTTLTATLYDEDGYEDDDYGVGTCVVSAVATSSNSFTSDTGSTVKVAQGASYTFKITSTDGTEPTFTVGGSGLTVTKVGKSGNAYYYKITATGTVGTSVGVYVNGTRTSVATITASTISIDTGATIKVKVGATYTFKVTSSTKPTFTTGNSATFAVTKTSVSGTSYYYTVKATGKAGASTGIYVNGVRRTVATVA